MKRCREIKKPDSTSQLVLEEVIGLTTKNANGLASAVSGSKCVYIAGCVVVVYHVDSCVQSHLVVSHRRPKSLCCVAVSHDASFVAAGESGGKPAVLVWKAATPALLGELKGHQYGVACLAFSPNGIQLASVGYTDDGYICLWDLRTQTIITKIKACSAVASVSFSLDAKFIVTAGRKHLKLWMVELPTRSRPNTRAISVANNGKPLNVGHCQGYSFIAVTYAHWSNERLVNNTLDNKSSYIYALADTGILCILSSGLAITSSVDLKVKKGLALSTSSRLVACACNNGIVKLYTINSLQYAGSLNFTSAKSCTKETTVGWRALVNGSKVQTVPTLPDAIACQFSTLEKLGKVVIYDDHSLYVWNLDDINEITRCCVLVSHSSCIWDIKNLPCENMHDPSFACVAKGCPGGVSFATCSADGSIRLWDLSTQPNLSEDSMNLVVSDSSIATKLGGDYHVTAGTFERDSVASGILSPGFRSMAVSSDGKYLAAGDCLGNIHIFNLYTSDYFCIQDAHDAEIMSLNFSHTSKRNVVRDEVSEGHYFLASGGQDRMIHIYDVERNFDLVGSVDEHSASVSSLKFISNGHKIASCSIRRSLMLHDVAVTQMGHKISQDHKFAFLGTSYDINIDPSTKNTLLVAEDKKINAVDISSGKLLRSIKYDEDVGYPVKVIVDACCSFVVCSYSHGSVCVYDYLTGKMVAQAAGHEGVITGIIFLPDCTHLVTVGHDGCIFIWKLPGHISTRLLQRTEENSRPLALDCISNPVTSCNFKPYQVENHQCPEKLPRKETLKQAKQIHYDQDIYSQRKCAFKFSISRLPKWAQDKVIPSGSVTADHTAFSKQSGQNFPSSINCQGDDDIISPGSTSPSRYNRKSSLQSSWSISRNLSDSDNQRSQKIQKTYNTFALDNRWSTIHTVCMDIMNSPEALDMKDQTVTLFGSNKMSQNQPVEMTKTIEGIVISNTGSIAKSPTASTLHPTKYAENKNTFLIKHPTSKTSDSLCNNVDQSSALHEEEVVQQKSDDLLLVPSKKEVSLTLNASASKTDFLQEDLLNLTSGGLSAELMCSHSPKSLQGRKSSAKKRQLGQFVVRMDLGDEKKFGNIFNPRGTMLSNLDAILEDASTSLPEVLHKMDIGMEVTIIRYSSRFYLNNLKSLLSINFEKESIHHISSSVHKGMPPIVCHLEDVLHSQDSKNARVNQQAEIFDAEQTKEESEEQTCLEGPKSERTEELAIASKNALFELDVAADHALKLLSQLSGPCLRDEVAQGLGNQLYKDATELLLPIARKLRSIAKLVQSASDSISSEKHT